MEWKRCVAHPPDLREKDLFFRFVFVKPVSFNKKQLTLPNPPALTMKINLFLNGTDVFMSVIRFFFNYWVGEFTLLYPTLFYLLSL